MEECNLNFINRLLTVAAFTSTLFSIIRIILINMFVLCFYFCMLICVLPYPQEINNYAVGEFPVLDDKIRNESAVEFPTDLPDSLQKFADDVQNNILNDLKFDDSESEMPVFNESTSPTNTTAEDAIHSVNNVLNSLKDVIGIIDDTQKIFRKTRIPMFNNSVKFSTKNLEHIMKMINSSASSFFDVKLVLLLILVAMSCKAEVNFSVIFNFVDMDFQKLMYKAMKNREQSANRIKQLKEVEERVKQKEKRDVESIRRFAEARLVEEKHEAERRLMEERRQLDARRRELDRQMAALNANQKKVPVKPIKNIVRNSDAQRSQQYEKALALMGRQNTGNSRNHNKTVSNGHGKFISDEHCRKSKTVLNSKEFLSAASSSSSSAFQKKEITSSLSGNNSNRSAVMLKKDLNSKAKAQNHRLNRTPIDFKSLMETAAMNKKLPVQSSHKELPSLRPEKRKDLKLNSQSNTRLVRDSQAVVSTGRNLPNPANVATSSSAKLKDATRLRTTVDSANRKGSVNGQQLNVLSKNGRGGVDAARMEHLRRQRLMNAQRQTSARLREVELRRELLRRKQQMFDYLSSESFDDEDEEDSDLDGFIDDSPIDDAEDYSKEIRRMFKYDPTKYKHLDKLDDRRMEASYADICREEAHSARVGLLEDLEDQYNIMEQMNVIDLIEHVGQVVHVCDFIAADLLLKGFKEENGDFVTNSDENFRSVLDNLEKLISAEKNYLSLAYIRDLKVKEAEDGPDALYGCVQAELMHIAEQAVEVSIEEEIVDLIGESSALLTLQQMCFYRNLLCIGTGEMERLKAITDNIELAVDVYYNTLPRPFLLGSLLNNLVDENEILYRLLLCQQCLSEANFKASFDYISEGYERLCKFDGYTSETPISDEVFLPSSTEQRKAYELECPLYIWYNSFFDFLITKFALYFHETLKKQATARVVQQCLKREPFMHVDRISSFCEINEANIFLFIDSRKLTYGQWTDAFLTDNFQTEQLHYFSILFTTEKKEDSTVPPELALQLINNEVQFESLDYLLTLTILNEFYVIRRIEGSIYCALAMKANDEEEEKSALAFLDDLCKRLRCDDVFASLQVPIS
ncbi:Protein SPT2 -like protein [Trichinella murrelli]|uniref:Protein SPT2-like protein n=1 Tax=Trichinella murrelli TaxID=144512 RepID=A0A0V0U070_9BILA|nr:Protein SPT2 -like protein [Trichinella murrelli]